MTAPAIPSSGAPLFDATIVVCTYNRADLLAATLDSLSAVRPGSLTWEAIVVDNNSTDGTRDVVQKRAASFPVPLRYLFEGVQGKSNALNAGVAASRGRIVVMTDDDVEVPAGWLVAAVAPLLERTDVDYTGGPVRPIWGGPRPRWLDELGNLGGTIAVKDHGPEPFVFEDRRKTPLGVNMAVRRSLLERVGGFRPDLGRNSRTLLGQEQADFFFRSRRAGVRGLYVPDMLVNHFVPAARLTRGYFRRWWYWKGVSHARLHGLHGTNELGVDLVRAPRLAGIPRFMLGTLLRHIGGWIRALVLRRPAVRAEHWLMMVYFAGYCREALGRGSRSPRPPTPVSESACP